MDRFARVVLGYHGCNTPDGIEFARQLLEGTAMIADWQPSANEYDWLGHGIYFWEHSPERARRWAGDGGSVIGAVIQLGRCFDLTNSEYTSLLCAAHENIVGLYAQKGVELPTNEGKDLKLRKLDCLVVNQFMTEMDNELDGRVGDDSFAYQSVRCPFEEGDEAFPGSMLKTETHIQIAVRDSNCILGVFRPNI